MALTDYLGDFDVGSVLGASGVFLQGLVIIVLLAGLIGALTWFMAMKKSYDKSIVVWRDVGGKPQIVSEDKGREISLPFTSTRALQLKKHKFFLPRPSLEVKKDLIFYYIRKDGEWNNVGIKDFDEELKTFGLSFDHSDMRMANASLKKLVEKNYKKLNWVKEYAPYIGFAILILMLGIAGYLFFKEASSVVGGLAGASEQLANTIESLNNILQSMDNIQSSSGVKNI